MSTQTIHGGSTTVDAPDPEFHRRLARLAFATGVLALAAIVAVITFSVTRPEAGADPTPAPPAVELDSSRGPNEGLRHYQAGGPRPSQLENETPSAASWPEPLAQYVEEFPDRWKQFQE